MEDEGDNSAPDGAVVKTVVSTPAESDVDIAFENWNTLATDFRLQRASKLTTERRRKLAARIKEHGQDGWIAALRQIEGSEFLRGKNDKNWAVTFDWLLNPMNFVKVYEGNYADERMNGRGGTH